MFVAVGFRCCVECLHPDALLCAVFTVAFQVAIVGESGGGMRGAEDETVATDAKTAASLPPRPVTLVDFVSLIDEGRYFGAVWLAAQL